MSIIVKYLDRKNKIKSNNVRWGRLALASARVTSFIEGSRKRGEVATRQHGRACVLITRISEAKVTRNSA